MVCTDDERLARRVSQFKGQGQDPTRRYWFPVIGYNYRMTNIEAAIGLAQLEMIDWHIARRREVASWYRQYLRDLPGIQFSPEMAWAKSVYWLSCVVLNSPQVDRDQVMRQMQENGIETRPFFYPMHSLPPYLEADGATTYPVAEYLSRSGINLPTSALMTENDVRRVVDALAEAIGL